MPRLLLTTLAFIAITLFGSCDKDSEPDSEAILHGMWMKGSNTGDTLYFLKKDGKHIMRVNQSFNPGVTAYIERYMEIGRASCRERV